jgi:hypothetical protein
MFVARGADVRTTQVGVTFALRAEMNDELPSRGARVRPLGPPQTILVDGSSWTVQEVIDPMTSTPVLIFSGPGVGRRVRNYPPNWRDLPAEQLYKLSWSR